MWRCRAPTASAGCGTGGFDARNSTYDIVDGTPYGKDVLRALSAACERHGLTIQVPAEAPDPIASVIALDVAGMPELKQ